MPQYRIVWNDGKVWYQRQITDRKTPFTLKGGGTKMIPIARPRIVVEGGKSFIFSATKNGEAVYRWHMRPTSALVNGR